MRAASKVFFWFVGSLALLACLVALLFFLAVQTQPGQGFVLRTALTQLDRTLDGELRVEGIHSPGLLRGFTLVGVSLSDDRGRPFLEADSLRVGYSVRRLLERRITLVPAEVWRPRVVVERLHGDTASNLSRILAPRDPRPDPVPEGPMVVLELRGVAIHDGDFLLRLPVEGEPGPRTVVETVPGFDGVHQRLQLSSIDAVLARAAILDPEREGEHFDFDRLSFTGRIFEEPFHVEGFRGAVRRVGSRIELDVEQLWFPGTELDGAFALEWGDAERGLVLEAELELDPVRFEDFRWLEPRIPDGEGRLSLSVEGPLSESRWRFGNADLRSGASRVRGRLGLDLGDELRFWDTELEVLPMELALLDPWLGEPLPVQGRLRGRARLDGPLRALRVNGELTFDDPARELPASAVRATGTLHLVEGAPGVSNLSLTADPLEYETLVAFLPDHPMRGSGTLRLEASGRLHTGLRMSADLRHRVGDDGQATRLLVTGSVREVAEDLRLALDATLDPLSFDGVSAGLGRELPLRGSITGQVRADGSLSDLEMGGRVNTAGGSFAFAVRTDVRAPERGYRAELTTQELDLTAFVAGAPDPTRIRGRAYLSGRGLTLEQVEGEGELELYDSRAGEVPIDRVSARFRARGGTLWVDTLEVRSPMGELDGEGDLALRREAPDGELFLRWSVPELRALRPVLIGDTASIAEPLTDLERLRLQFEGIDPDTLPDPGEAPLDGRLHGEVRLVGGLADLRGDGFVEVEALEWREAVLERGRVGFTGRWAGADVRRVDALLDLEAPAWGRWSLEGVTGEVRHGDGAGEASLSLRRGEGEAYRAVGGYALDSLGVDVRLTDLAMDLDDVEWRLLRPAEIRAERRRVRVDDLEVARPNARVDEPVRLRVDGVVDLDGASDLRVEAEGVDLERLASILQYEPAPGGTLTLDLLLGGPAEAPEIDGRVLIRDLEVGGTVVSRVEGTLAYGDRQARTRLHVDQNGQRALTVTGTYPVDLSFHDVETRLPDRDVDLAIEVDSLPAATVLGVLDVLEDVEGILDGRIVFRGRPRDLRPSGSLTLRDGALSLPEIGLHPRAVNAEFTLDPDGIVRVEATARARGVARVYGTLDLTDLTDPGFDLVIRTEGFQVAERRDLDARIGGEVTLTGQYSRAQIGGSVRVEEGTIFLEEFARTAEVVDLTDPAFWNVVDTSLVAVRPVVEAAQNPFIQNLRVDVDLAIQRDFWLRSREMNVEMAGDLIVTFDRRDREILLVGTLQAVRGNYVAFGRQFQVRSGTVEFVGTPGINPALDIEAVHRLRRQGGEPMEISATVAGTLVSPRIRLSSDAQPPIAESDLISYLIFGRPSYALASGETSILQGAAGAGVSVGIGTLATQLSAVVAQQVGLDYFTITQAQEGIGPGGADGFAGTFAGTQIEVGQYILDDLFLALVLRPLRGIGGTAAQLPGARLEWRFSDLWTLEAFIEDRFGREAVHSFGDAGFRLNRILGVDVYREWSY